MNMTAERLWLDAVSDVLNRSHLFQPGQLADAVDAAVSRLGIRTTVYLVDDEQRALHPVPQGDPALTRQQMCDADPPGDVRHVV
jgi:sigma-B regulation protein RsbU (phosphoserine phosphatase)